MAKVSFDIDLCKGCQLCINACPMKIVHLTKDRLNKKGHYYAEVTEMEKCTGCASCATMCPDCVITVEK